MSKRTAIVLLTAVLVLCLAGSVFAEAYKSKKFPPTSVLKKVSIGLLKKNDMTFSSVAGKYKALDGSWVVYLYVTKAGQKKFLTQPLVLRQLDSNLWTIVVATSKATLLEK